MAGHLLVLEHLAGVLTAAGAADRTVRDRHAVRSAKSAEIPSLHATGEALANAGSGDIDELTNDEMIGGDLRTNRNHGIVTDAKFSQSALGLDLGDREAAALGLAHVLHLAGAGTELKRDVAVLLLAAMRDHLALRKTQ